MTAYDILVKYQTGLFTGLLVTLRLCAIIWSVGIVTGVLLGAASVKWPLWIGLPSRTASFILSGIPVLVFLYWLHYPAQAMLNVVIDPFYTAALTLTILNAFAVADLVRGVLTDFPEEYLIAARVCGMSWKTTFWKIQLPIIFRQILPTLLIIQVSMLQATLFASLISVDELFRIAQRINSEVYKPVEIYTALGVFYLATCLPLNGLAIWLRMRFTRNLSDR